MSHASRYLPTIVICAQRSDTKRHAPPRMHGARTVSGARNVTSSQALLSFARGVTPCRVRGQGVDRERSTRGRQNPATGHPVRPVEHVHRLVSQAIENGSRIEQRYAKVPRQSATAHGPLRPVGCYRLTPKAHAMTRKRSRMPIRFQCVARGSSVCSSTAGRKDCSRLAFCPVLNAALSSAS